MRKLPLLLILFVAIGAPVASTLLFYFAPPTAVIARGEIPPPTKTPQEWNLHKGKWTLLFAAKNETCGEECKKRLCQMRQLRLMLPGNYFRLQRAWLRPQTANANAYKKSTANKNANTFANKNESANATANENKISIANANAPANKTATANATTNAIANKNESVNENEVATANTPPQLTASADCGESRAAAFATTAEKINITDGVLFLRGNATALPAPAKPNTRADYLYLIDPAGIVAMRFPPDLDIYAVRQDLAKILKISRGRKHFAE